MSGRRQDEGGWDDGSDPQGIELIGVSEAGAVVEGPASESVRPSGFALGGGPGPRRRRGRPGGLEHEGRSSRSDLGTLTASQRFLILDSWSRSGLTAGAFAPLVGVSVHTLYEWKKRFDRLGPAGLEPRPLGGPRGSRMEEIAKRAVLRLKAAHPEWGDRAADARAGADAEPGAGRAAHGRGGAGGREAACAGEAAVSARGAQLPYSTVRIVFRGLSTGLGWEDHIPRPRIHDLRHTFACRRLKQWYADGADVSHGVASPATYLGHAKVSDTYWYLTGTPELLALAAARFEAFAGPAGEAQ